MKLVESYSLNTSARIEKPFMLSHFYPLSCDKYIVLQPQGGMEAKSYSLWDEVVELIKPSLDAEGISIVQIGSEDDVPVQHCIQTQGRTTLYQTNYIIQNCLALLSVDSFSVHLASSYDIPTCALYSISPPEIAGGYWGSPENKRYLFPSNIKPSYNPNEHPKTIDTIKPERVARNILELLFEKSEFCQRQSLFLGPRHSNSLVEVIPSYILGYSVEPSILNIRCDYFTEEQLSNEDVYGSLFANVRNQKCTILTKHSLPISHLKALKHNIFAVMQEVDDDTSTEFLKECKKNGLRIGAFCKNITSDLKFKWFEICNLQQLPVYPGLIQTIIDNNTNSDKILKVKTQKMLFGGGNNGEKYNSYAAMLLDLEGEVIEWPKNAPEEVVEALKAEWEHLYLFEE